MATLDPSLMKPSNKNEEEFRRKLLWHSELIKLIEDNIVQQYALQFIPAEDLTIKASQALSTLEDNSSIEDCLVIELLQWFKHSFFSWVDSPACSNCNQLTEHRGFVKATRDELVWLASGVENYFCAACQMYTRFPRYNHPKKLLETRKGRCGEWAICFTLVCRALDLDARLILDWTDHLWTEMFSSSQQRWIHCDACENLCDQPLLYEIGWKKKLYFIIAFSKDEVQDVTWRYSLDFAGVLKRRLMFQCRESFVLSWINYCTKQCRSNTSAKKCELLLKRQVLELAEFLTPPKPNKEALSGRTSGSVAWRVARGEISTENVCSSFAFNLRETEVEKRYFHIKYNSAFDEYVRVSDNYIKYKTWNSCAFNVKNMFRKLETDWKTAYLARTEGSSQGVIIWKFDFERSSLAISKLKLNLLGTTFQNGKVMWSIQAIKTSGEQIKKVFHNSVLDQTFCNSEDFKGTNGLIIKAELSEGNGPQAWQHAQLFRQALGSTEFPFEVEIYLEKS